MEGVQLKRGVVERMMAQKGRELGPQPGNHHPLPDPSYLAGTSVAAHFPGNEEDPFFSIQHLSPGKQATIEPTTVQEKCSEASSAVLVRVPSEDDSTLVVDMGVKMAPVPVEKDFHISGEAIALEQGNRIIKWRKPFVVKADPTDVFPQPTETKWEGIVKTGGFEEVVQMCREQSAQMEKGVICNTKVLHSVNGDYEENEHYAINPAKFKGGFGECSMGQDLTTGGSFIRKTVSGVWKNEVLVPLRLGHMPGIPEVYGIIRKGPMTQIFQKFAGDSLEKLCRQDSGYADLMKGLDNMLVLAFQGFKTLDRLHEKGVQHLDVKPDNLCVDMGDKKRPLYLIDFGSCQTPGEVINQGVTYEYMSPECAITHIENQKVGRELQRPLEQSTDVWAMTLSLMYCLLGHHVMVKAFTGNTFYKETEKERDMKRVACLIWITQLKDSDVAKLIDTAWPAELRELFTNTLRVKREHRWSAKQAADFALGHIMKRQARRLQAQAKMPSSSVGQLAHTSRCVGGQSTSAVSTIVKPSAPAERPAQAQAHGNSSAAIAAAIRLRGQVARIVPAENHLSPWNVAASPGIQVRQVVPPAPCVLTRATVVIPGKRRLEEDEQLVQICKIIRK